MSFLIAMITGIVLPVQTSINSKFRFKVDSPYLASAIAMVTGMLFMLIVGLVARQPLGLGPHFWFHNPWWLFLGGVTGAIAYTIKIVLLPHLGAVQTVTMPILGLIIMSMLIDNFGWFNLPVNRFNLIRFIGILALLAGVMLVVYRKKKKSKDEESLLPWQILGILAGLALAIQTSSNGALGRAAHSTVQAGVFSFASGSVLMVLAVGIFQRNLHHVVKATGRGSRWWIWLGGPLGAIYAFSSLSLAPIMGAGTTIVLTILGNIAGSLVIDKFGLLGVARRHVGIKQYSGLIVMIIGIALVKLF